MEEVSLLEILIWEGVSLLEILTWVHYKGMWIKKLRICPIRIEIIYGRVSLLEILIWVSLSAQFIPLAFARGTIFTQIILPILKSPTNLPLPSIIS